MTIKNGIQWYANEIRIKAYLNSVVFVLDHCDAMAEYTGVGTGYSAIKFPCVSLTLRVSPRLIVCLRLQALSRPLVDADMAGRGPTSA